MVRQPCVAATAWAVCVLAVTLVGVACAPDPAQLRAQRTIDAEYDIETGRLELITFDSDDNGTAEATPPSPTFIAPCCAPASVLYRTSVAAHWLARFRKRSEGVSDEASAWQGATREHAGGM